jgi:hypothetical protein
MEDVMQAGTLRKLKPIGDLANPFHDLERTSIARTKLALGARVQ